MTNKTKLFIIINRLVLGGHSADAVSLAQRLTADYEVTILYGEKESEEIEVPRFKETHPSITFLKLPSLHRSLLPVQDIKVFRQMISLLKKNKPDIVHTHGFKSGLLGRLAAKKAKIPVVIHTYHGHHFHSYYNRFLSNIIVRVERWMANVTTRLIAISPQQAYEIGTVYRIAPQNKISTIYLGIEKADYKATVAPGTLRNEYGIKDDEVVIGIIGRLVPIKNHSLFVQVAGNVLQQRKNVRFLIIGDGHTKQMIQQQFTNKKIRWQESKKHDSAPVIFTSWITNIADVLPDIDIVVQTSLNEGTPVALIEAQLFQKPVVATSVGGVKDTVENGASGFLIDDFDVDDFTTKLLCLTDDTNRRTAMGKRGYLFAAERFSKHKEVEAIRALYTRCLLQQKSTTL